GVSATAADGRRRAYPPPDRARPEGQLAAGRGLRRRALRRSLVLDRRRRSPIEGCVHLPANPVDAGGYGRKATAAGDEDSGQLTPSIGRVRPKPDGLAGHL